MRTDKKLANWVRMHRIKSSFIVAFCGVTIYFEFFPCNLKIKAGFFSLFTRKEKVSKKLRRWILGERNLPPDSITETVIKV